LPLKIEQSQRIWVKYMLGLPAAAACGRISGPTHALLTLQ